MLALLPSFLAGAICGIAFATTAIALIYRAASKSAIEAESDPRKFLNRNPKHQ